MDRGRIDNIVARAEAREKLIGRTTLQRAIVANTFSRAKSAEDWKQLLVQLSSIGANTDLGALDGSFYSKTTATPTTGNTTNLINQAIDKVFGIGSAKRMAKVKVVQSKSELPANVNSLSAQFNTQPQAYFDPATQEVTLIADNIPTGNEVAVLLHELSHKNLDKAVGAFNMTPLRKGIDAWASAKVGSNERKVYDKANQRAIDSKQYDAEIIAYAIEEAELLGLSPDVNAPVGTVQKWLALAKDLFTSAIKKLTGGTGTPKLTVSDLTAIARGAAALELERNSNNEIDAEKYQRTLTEKQDAIARLKEDGARLKVTPFYDVTVYHGTSEQNEKSIRKNGFDKFSYFSQNKSGTQYGDSPIDVAKRKFKKDAVVMQVNIDPRFLSTAAAGSELYSEYKLENDNGVFTNKDIVNSYICFSQSAMKSVEANMQRGKSAMNEALLNKADVKRAMYHNELGWIDFVWGDNLKGIQHIVKQRTTKDGLDANELYKLLTKNLIETIATGETIKETRISNSENVRIENKGYRAVLVKNKGNNGWLLTGFKLDEQVNQGRGATASELRTNAPILTRDNVVAAQNELSTLARSNVNSDIRFSLSSTIKDIKDRVSAPTNKADDAFNLNQMLTTSYNYVKQSLPEISNLVYDFNAKELKDIRNDQAVDDSRITSIVASPEAKDETSKPADKTSAAKRAETIEYYRNEKSLEQSSMLHPDISLVGMVQSARDLDRIILSENDVVNKYGSRFSRNDATSGTNNPTYYSALTRACCYATSFDPSNAKYIDPLKIQ